MRKHNLIVLSILFIVSMVTVSMGTAEGFYASEDADEEIMPGDGPAEESWACRNLGGIWCWF